MTVLSIEDSLIQQTFRITNMAPGELKAVCRDWTECNMVWFLALTNHFASCVFIGAMAIHSYSFFGSQSASSRGFALYKLQIYKSQILV